MTVAKATIILIVALTLFWFYEIRREKATRGREDWPSSDSTDGDVCRMKTNK